MGALVVLEKLYFSSLKTVLEEVVLRAIAT